jgi:DNA-binding GntR family transcriptional regulator
MPPFDAPPLRRRAAASELDAWLAARIVEHLKEVGAGPGSHVTEQELANRFQVSRTPVRAALAVLAKSGAVERRPHRGYFVATPPAALAGAAVAQVEEDKLYYRVAEDRLTGRLGARVTEAELVRRYRASRARVAATLSRMAHEGWLQRLPGHGWSFEPMLDSVKGYEDGYRFRALVEPAALRQPGYHLAPEAIALSRERHRDLLRHGERYSNAQVFDVGAQFHELLVSGANNPFLLDAVRRVNALRRLLEYRAKRNRAKIEGQYHEHMKLLDLIEAGKLEAAAKMLERHLAEALRVKAPLVRAKAAT